MNNPVKKEPLKTSLSSKVMQLLLAAIAGGLISGFFDFAKFNRSADYERQDAYIERISVENQTLRVELKEQQVMYNALFIQVQELQNKIILLESATNDLPFPMWLKDITGRMLAVNPAYEKTFLNPRGLTGKDYIGFYDSDIWDAKTAAMFRSHDQEVLQTGKTLRVVEIIPTPEGKKVPYQVVKYARKIGSTVIGIAGYAMPVD